MLQLVPTAEQHGAAERGLLPFWGEGREFRLARRVKTAYNRAEREGSRSWGRSPRTRPRKAIRAAQLRISYFHGPDHAGAATASVS